MNTQSIGYIVSASILVYALVYKIPLPCFGCDKGSFWYRCVFDTGYGTKSCSAHQVASSRVNGIQDIASEAGEFLDNLWEFTKTELPETIKEFILTLKNLILGLKNAISEKISLVIKFLKEKISLFVGKIKETVSSTYETFLKNVVNPLVTFAMNNIVSPVVNIFEKISAFRTLVWTTISNSVDRFANIPIGSFVGDVVDVFKNIPEALENLKVKIVELINNMKNGMVNGVNSGIKSSIKGIETSINTVSDGIDGSVNKIIGGMNFTKDSLIDGINSGINGAASGIEFAVNKSSQGIENVVNTSLNSITGGMNTSLDRVESGINSSTKKISSEINSVSGKVEAGVGKVITSVNSVIGGVEAGLGSITSAINTSLNGVENAINGVSSGINNAVNGIVSKVNGIGGSINKLRGIDMGINNRFVNWNISPFGSLPRVGSVPTLDINRVDMRSVPSKKFNRVNASLNIPDVNIPTVNIPTIPSVDINIPDIDIPNVDIDAPPDIKDIDIPHVTIPVVEIPSIPDINPEVISIPAIPGFGFVSEKVAEIKESIINLFESAMVPLYDGVATLIALVTTLVSATVNFFRDQLSWSNIKEKFSQLTGLASDGIGKLKSLLVDDVVPGLINLLLSVKEPVLNFVANVSTTIWRFLQKVGMNVSDLIKNVYKTVTKVTAMVASNVASMGIYVVGSSIEKYTSFVPIPLSLKIAIILASVIWILFGQFAKGMGDITRLGGKFVKFALQALVDLDAKVDKLAGIGNVEKVIKSSFII